MHMQCKGKKRNTIKGLMDEQGKWCEDEREIGKIATDYFSSFFQTQGVCSLSEVIEVVELRITKEMNAFLLTEFTIDEMVIAIKQMHPSKAHGLDGTSAIFFFSKILARR